MRMFNLEDRGPMIIEPGEKVYQGMIIGIHTRDNDLEVNVLEGQAADQHPRRRQGRGRQADPADPHDARPRALLDPGRRADGSHAEVDPPAQDLSRSERPQALRQVEGSSLSRPENTIRKSPAASRGFLLCAAYRTACSRG